MGTREKPQESDARTVSAPGAFASYEALRENVRELSENLSKQYREYLKCGAGCSACCQHDLSVFPVEAAWVRMATDRLPDEVQARIRAQAKTLANQEDGPCPFLVDDKCAIYESRPLICMTQGLPLMFEAEDGESEVDFCPLNFDTREGIESLTEDALVPLDSLNLKLAIANTLFRRSADIEESSVRLRMSSIVMDIK